MPQMSRYDSEPILNRIRRGSVENMEDNIETAIEEAYNVGYNDGYDEGKNQAE